MFKNVLPTQSRIIVVQICLISVSINLLRVIYVKYKYRKYNNVKLQLRIINCEIKHATRYKLLKI